MFDFTKYNEMISEIRRLETAAMEELVAIGFKDFIHDCIYDKEFDKIIAELKKMEDSQTKGYIKRILKKDHGIEV